MSGAELLFFFAGGVLGVLIAAVLVQRSARRAQHRAVREAIGAERALLQTELIQNTERLQAKQGEIEQVRRQLHELNLQLEALRALHLSAREDVTRLSTELAEVRERSAAQLTFFDTARETLNTQFKSLASEILEEKGRRLSELHRGELGLVLAPLSEKLQAFQNKVEEVYVSEAQQRFSLFQEVQKLHAANIRIGEEATNLTRALKGEAKTRGNWGEVMLEAILERSGLAKGREYEVQMSVASDDGLLRPDIVVRLPDQKHIVIDSKVSLLAYDRFYSAENESQRSLALAEHVASMRRHVNELSRKNYQGQEALNSPDFVAMFVPIEPAFTLAAGADQSLVVDAFDKKVVLVSPGTLLAMLSTVASLWRREQQSRHALEIARQSGEIYDKFVGVVDALLDLGEKLDHAQKSFLKARNRLSDGPGNVLRKLEALKQLGAKANKSLPVDLLARAGVATDTIDSPSDAAPKDPDAAAV